jgi:methyl-accepting chemotaxis protein
MGAFQRLSVAGKMLVAGGAVVGLLLLMAAFAVSQHTRGVAQTLSGNYAEALGEGAAADVEGQLVEVGGVVRAMATGIGAAHESGIRDRAAIVTMLKPNADATPIVLASWFMALPDAWDGQDATFLGNTALGSNSKGAFAPYWVKSDGKLIMEPLDNANDYEEPYFKDPSASGKMAIVEPYSYDIEGKPTLITTISAPVYSNGKLIGVAGIDLALGDISAMLGKMKPFGTGEVMLLSSDAKWVSHPNSKLRTQTYADAGAAEVKAAIAAGKSIHVKGATNQDGDKVDRLITPEPMAGLNSTWALVTDIPVKTINGPADRLAFGLMAGGLVILGVVLAALFAATNVVVRRPLARLSAAVAALGAGRYDEPVRGTEAKDELGGIARALEGFRHDLAETGRLRTDQERARAEADAERSRNDQARRANEAAQELVVASLGEGLEKLASGDLTWRLNQDFPAEYRKIQDDFNAAIGRLQEAMVVIVGNAAGINSTTSEISQAADDLSRRTEQQAASLEETAAALDQITATVRKTAEGATRASTVVAEARKGAQHSGEVVGQAVEAMRGIEASSQQISQITGVIDEIAFQTNLLALNAGVEAARAGDAGKGFAVVAQEVRALAQRSAEAAKEIKQLIASSSGQVEQGVKLVGQTGQALGRIVAEVAEINALVTEIAASAHEQATGLGQVNTAVNQMDQVTQQNAAMVEQSTAASHSLAHEASDLAQLVAKFRIGEQAAAARPAAPRAPAPRAAPASAPRPEPVASAPAAPAPAPRPAAPKPAPAAARAPVYRTEGATARKPAYDADDWTEF